MMDPPVASAPVDLGIRTVGGVARRESKVEGRNVEWRRREDKLMCRVTRGWSAPAGKEKERRFRVSSFEFRYWKGKAREVVGYWWAGGAGEVERRETREGIGVRESGG